MIAPGSSFGLQAHLLVTSAGSANGGGHDALLAFDAAGRAMGALSTDPRIVDPRGLSLDPSGALIYLNSGDDRVLAPIVTARSYATPDGSSD